MKCPLKLGRIITWQDPSTDPGYTVVLMETQMSTGTYPTLSLKDAW